MRQMIRRFHLWGLFILYGLAEQGEAYIADLSIGFMLVHKKPFRFFGNKPDIDCPSMASDIRLQLARVPALHMATRSVEPANRGLGDGRALDGLL